MLIFSPRSCSSKTTSGYLRGRGFTIIELLVVMGIMLIVTSVLLVRQSKFDSSTLLRSLAYSVALSVRQAQVYGTSVFGTTTTLAGCAAGNYQSGTGTCFAPGYGIYVLASNPAAYTLFADLNNNGTYDTGEDARVYNLGKGYSISRFCATTGGGMQYCSGEVITWLAMVYRRPNPEACITTNDILGVGSGVCAVGASAVYATSSIQIQFTGGDTGSTRSIYINSTGQISVGNSGT